MNKEERCCVGYILKPLKYKSLTPRCVFGSAQLGRNREKIQSARSKVLEVSSMTNQARRLVHSMSKRETQQKIMMYGLAFILIGAIVVVVYYMQKD